MKKLSLLLCSLGLLALNAQASEELAKAKNCSTCHNAERKIVGPSYKDIAAKKGLTEAILVQKIKQGSKGEWGAVPMPPNNVTDAEAATLAKWVLSHK